MSGYIGPIPVPQGIQNKESFTATAAQTTFNTNGYTDGAFISVYLNGVRLVNGTDYTATNGSDVVLASAANTGDVLDFESFNSFSLVSQTFDNLTTKNPTHEDTDGGRESALSFQGEQSGGEISTLAAIQASHDGTSDDQKGDLIFKTNDGSDNNAPTEAMRIDSSGQVGIGTSSPTVSNGKGLVIADATAARLKLCDTTTGEGASDGVQLGHSGGIGFLFNHENEAFQFGTNNAERMRIDSVGNLNIGSTTNVGYGPLQIGSTSTSPTILQMVGSTSSNNAIHFGDGTSGDDRYRGFVQYGHADNALLFGTNAAERMRLDANYNFLFGLTTANSFPTGNNFLQVNGVSGASMVLGGHTGTHTVLQFRHNGAATVGSIVVDGSSTTYNTSSDYRLKENVTDISDGITRVKQLKPKRFNFIADADKTVDGFLAHEASTVVPEAVTGTKDGLEVWKEKEKSELPDGVSVGDNKLDDDGNTIPKMQGIDQAKLVPLLTAALQEAIAKIETLESENTAIKARLDALEAE